MAIKPANSSYQQVATVPYGAIAPCYYFKEQGRVQPGQKVLINGASGTMGTYAVQLACHFGAQVTAVCRGKNFDLVKSLGAAHLVDYTREDFYEKGDRYDLVFDAVGKLSSSRGVQSLAPDGRFLTIIKGGPNEHQQLAMLKFLTTLLEVGQFRAVIDRVFPLEQTVEAHRYVASGKKYGNVVIAVVPEGSEAPRWSLN